MKVLLVKNISREGPGLLEPLLEKNTIPFDLVDLHKGEAFPDPSGYQALFVFGGPDSANDQTPKMLQEISQIKKTLDAGIPYFGICLGMQTLIKAAGGNVIKSPIKEVGWKDITGNYFEIELTEEGQTDPLFLGLEDSMPTFQLHGETVVLTPEMTLLAKGKYCKNQVIKVGENAYGTQCHLELTPEMHEVWISEDPDLQPLGKEQLRRDYEKIKSSYEATGTILLENFLRIAEIIE